MSFLQQRCSQYTMQQMASTYGSSSMQITTELIQKYLDENKQLILAILDNQSLGKIQDCATFSLDLPLFGLGLSSKGRESNLCLS
ncbi:unnamed protein product, partial [Sphagnum troendelagicum]